MADLFSVRGRTALVTGASRGIGKTLALGLAEAGAELIVTARDAEKLSETVAEIEASGGKARALAFDLADLAAVQAACDGLNAEGAPVDILVNNGAIGGWGALHDSTITHWNSMFDTNVGSMYLMCRELSRGMVARKWGRIINFGSYVSFTGRPNLSAYVASKHAVVGLTRAVAADLAPHGVTCNGVAPGFVDTDMAAPTVGNPRRAKIFRDTIAMGRFADTSDLVGPVLFLASEASRYVTGHMLPVDGGVAEILSLPVVVET